MRYCITQDNDCQWYLIDADTKDYFYALLELSDFKGDYDKFHVEFEQYMVDGPDNLTFKEPSVK